VDSCGPGHSPGQRKLLPFGACTDHLLVIEDINWVIRSRAISVNLPTCGPGTRKEATKHHHLTVMLAIIPADAISDSVSL
jgi:hypothetical protein